MKNRSTLKQHKWTKGGLIETPLNSLKGIKPISWSKDRLPEYLWLGLILMSYNRKEAFKKIVAILRRIVEELSNLNESRLSLIFSLPAKQQHIIYQIIAANIDIRVMSPLTAIYMEPKHDIFNTYFYCTEVKFIERIEILAKAVKMFYEHQSYMATDLRFCAMLIAILRKRIIFNSKCKNSIEAIIHYAELDHEDEEMSKFRPLIRSMEPMAPFSSINDEFNFNFWRSLSMKTECNPIRISYADQDIEDYITIITEFKDKLNYLTRLYKDKLIFDTKFNVLIGLAVYTLKISNEIIEHKLGNSVIGRNAFRTIIETYIMMKYLIKVEAEQPNVWEEYKLYGIGKYKHHLLTKERDNIDDSSCFNQEFINAIINEIKWEEFLDIDTDYFNGKIKDKFKGVAEENLYNFEYEYNTNFVHAFWGAIRESSMYLCDNASHQYHLFPDINLDVKLSCIYNDIHKMLNKIFAFVDTVYPIHDVSEARVDKDK